MGIRWDREVEMEEMRPLKRRQMGRKDMEAQRQKMEIGIEKMAIGIEKGEVEREKKK